MSFNKTLIEQYVQGKKAIVFDPSYINKTGKHTDGVGYYWSGVAGRAKWGLELGGLAVLDIDRHTAFHLTAIQTVDVKADESLLAFYARKLLEHKDELLTLSKHMVVDAYFSKDSFVKPLCDKGFDIISRLRNDANLNYLYQGEQKKGRGRPKQYDGKVDFTQLKPTHANCVSEQDQEKIYQLQAYSVALKRKLNVVIVYTARRKKGKLTWQHQIYFSTDLTQDWQDVLKLYKARFQIEFLYRDAKQHTGLNDCEARCKNKIACHWNLSLTAINLAKVRYWLPQKDASPNTDVPFSMADIKTRYNNKLMLNRFISMFAINPKLKINSEKIAQFLDFGRQAA